MDKIEITDVEEEGPKAQNQSFRGRKPHTSKLVSFQKQKPKVPDFANRMTNTIPVPQADGKGKEAFEFSFKHNMPQKKRRSRHSRIYKAQLTERG